MDLERSNPKRLLLLDKSNPLREPWVLKIAHKAALSQLLRCAEYLWDGEGRTLNHRICCGTKHDIWEIRRFFKRYFPVRKHFPDQCRWNYPMDLLEETFKEFGWEWPNRDYLGGEAPPIEEQELDFFWFGSKGETE
jgi:hypothetical protein